MLRAARRMLSQSDIGLTRSVLQGECGCAREPCQDMKQGSHFREPFRSHSPFSSTHVIVAALNLQTTGPPPHSATAINLTTYPLLRAKGWHGLGMLQRPELPEAQQGTTTPRNNSGPMGSGVWRCLEHGGFEGPLT